MEDKAGLVDIDPPVMCASTFANSPSCGRGVLNVTYPFISNIIAHPQMQVVVFNRLSEGVLFWRPCFKKDVDGMD